MKDNAEKGSGTAKAKAQVPFVKEVFKGGCSLRVVYWDRISESLLMTLKRHRVKLKAQKAGSCNGWLIHMEWSLLGFWQDSGWKKMQRHHQSSVTIGLWLSDKDEENSVWVNSKNLKTQVFTGRKKNNDLSTTVGSWENTMILSPWGQLRHYRKLEASLWENCKIVCPLSRVRFQLIIIVIVIKMFIDTLHSRHSSKYFYIY